MTIVKSEKLKRLETKAITSKSRTFESGNLKVTFKDENSSLRSPFQYYIFDNKVWKNIKLIELENILLDSNI